MVPSVEDKYIDQLIEYIYEKEVNERADLMDVDYEVVEAIIRLTFLKMERDGKIKIDYR